MVNFFSPIIPNPTVVENYPSLRCCDNFFNPFISAKHSFKILSHDQVTLVKVQKRKEESIYSTAFKALCCFTLIIPALALIGKVIYRCVNQFLDQELLNKDKIALFDTRQTVQFLQEQIESLENEKNGTALLRLRDGIVLTQYSQRINNLRNQNKNLTNILLHKANKIAQLTQSVNGHTSAQTTHLEQENEGLKKTQESQITIISQLKENLRLLTAQSQEQVDQYTIERQSLVSTCESQATKIQQLTIDFNNCQKELKAKQSEIGVLNNSITEKRQVIIDLRKMLQNAIPLINRNITGNSTGTTEGSITPTSTSDNINSIGDKVLSSSDSSRSSTPDDHQNIKNEPPPTAAQIEATLQNLNRPHESPHNSDEIKENRRDETESNQLSEVDSGYSSCDELDDEVPLNISHAITIPMESKGTWYDLIDFFNTSSNNILNTGSNIISTSIKRLGLTESSDPKFLSWKVIRFEEIITSFRQQIHIYIENNRLIELNKDPKKPDWYLVIEPLLTAVNYQFKTNEQRITLDNLNELRKLYNERIIGNIRLMSEWASKNPNAEGVHHVDALCSLIYTSNLNALCKTIYQTFIKLGKQATKNKVIEYPRNLKKYPFIGKLLKRYQLVYETPTDAKAGAINKVINSAKGTFNISFDPNTQSNPMHVLYNKIITCNTCYGTTQCIKDIAMGSPTIEDGINSVIINPEFMAFLRNYKRQGLVHLYVNNQNMIPSAALIKLLGDEIPRCKAIHKLAEGEFLNTFYAITLSQNSHFFEQKKCEDKAELFKSKLIHEVFVEDSTISGSCIPTSLQTEFRLKEWGIQAASQIHAMLFGSRAKLEPIERRIFIRLFYLYLTRHIMISVKANSHNTSCKDRIDRGASSDAEDFANLLILNDKENDQGMTEFFETLVFARAIIVRKREIIENRLERLIETVKFMLDNKPQIKALTAVLFPHTKLSLQID